MSDVDVLGPRMLIGVLGNIDSSSIITVDNHSILRESVVPQQISTSVPQRTHGQVSLK
jgi:hypothetical protein